MPDPISIPSIRVMPEASATKAISPVGKQGSFAEVLSKKDLQANPLASALKGAAKSISRGEQMVDKAIRGASRTEVSPERLLALQAGVYRYTQELELASKLVDKATSAIKQTLQSQQ